MELIINPIGGLANRMRAIVSAIALCNDYNLTLKEIIWAVNSELYCPFEELFEPVLDIKVTDISKLRQLFYFDKPRKQNLFLSNIFNCKCNKLYIDNSLDLSSLPRNSKKNLLISSGIVFYDFSAELYRQIIRPKQELVAQAQNRIRHNNTIGLHIRRTDNVVSIKESPLELFIAAIDSELKNGEFIRQYPKRSGATLTVIRK